MGSTLVKMQPTLIHVPVKKDVVYTPGWLSKAVVEHFQPSGSCLDPCLGDGSFYKHLPFQSRDWCEIDKGKDFYSQRGHFDWVIGNPPYSHLLSWIRHSFIIADNIAYLVPLHRVMASESFLVDLQKFGGLKEVLQIGTGTTAGFPFGHALVVVHYQRDYFGGTFWTRLDVKKAKKKVIKS